MAGIADRAGTSNHVTNSSFRSNWPDQVITYHLPWAQHSKAYQRINRSHKSLTGQDGQASRPVLWPSHPEPIEAWQTCRFLSHSCCRKTRVPNWFIWSTRNPELTCYPCPPSHIYWLGATVTPPHEQPISWPAPSFKQRHTWIHVTPLNPRNPS